jgi:integrase
MKPWKVTLKSGETRWQIFYRDPEGKGIGKRFKTKRDADAYLAKVMVAKEENRYHDVFDVKKETQTIFNDLLNLYEQNFKTQRSYKTKIFIIQELRKEFGARKLSQITYKDLETWRNQRKATPTRSGGVRSDGSVNLEAAVFSHILAKAVEWELLERNPFKRGKRLMYRLNNQRDRYLSEAEIERLLQECPRHFRPIVETALHTGMRKGELIGLRWEQYRDGLIHLKETKSGKGRKIPVNDRLAEILQELRRGNQLKSPFVFLDARGRQLIDVKSPFAGALRRAGIENCTFHDLRHTFASHLVMSGVDLSTVQRLLGHASITMTMRYAHLAPGHLQDAVAVLNKLPGGAKFSLNFSKDDGKKAEAL